MLKKPQESEYADFQTKYILRVPEDVMPYLETQKSTLTSYLSSIEERDLDEKYGPDKWSIREVILHIVDTEIIFNYRALCTSRYEKQILPGFDQDDYILPEQFKNLDKNYILDYFCKTRDASIIMFKGFTDAQWLQVGHMSSYTMTLRSFPFMLAGHFDHHMQILKERYLV